MALDPRFLTAPSLQMVFRDKDTGLPLRDGYVKFFSDIARTVPKSVYKLSGSPPDYSYTDIGSTIVLTGIGTFSDGLGKDIIPYYFPFDGTQDTTTNKPELYFIQVYSNSNILQFSREGWPNEFGEENETSNIVNYIPNGQFLLHTDIPADIFEDLEDGQIRLPVTEIAQGGFTFERSVGTTARDFVIFDRIGDYVDNPTGSPRYSINILCQSPGTGADFKDIRIKFLDVNKFASLTQKYTFSITGRTNAGTSIDIGIFLIKNFGTGGDTETDTEIGTCTLTDSYTICDQAFIFGTNVDSTIGLLNDDYLQLAVRFPTDQIFDINLANFVLTIGDIAITTFPVTTNDKFINDSLVPDDVVPTGNDLGLTLRSTMNGMEFDQDEVGNISSSILTTKEWYHLCDGTQLLTSGYQPNGVPNSRLWKKLYNPFSALPMFGTGAAFMCSLNNGPPFQSNSQMVVHNNTLGAVSAASDGTIPTGFTFSNIHVGDDGYSFFSFWYADSSFSTWNNSFGAATPSQVATSGFASDDTFYRNGSPLTAQIGGFIATNATGLAGKYFTFATPTVSYYCWFKVDGVGVDPAPGGTGVLVNLLSTDIARYVAQKIANSLNGFQVTGVVLTAASLITPGSYFNLYTIGGPITHYYVWYKVDGIGIDPAPIGGTGILVNILSTDTQFQVQTKTVMQINSMYYAVPDFRGQFLRMLDKPNNYDLSQRFSFYADNLTGLQLGTYEFDSNLSHTHQLPDSLSDSGYGVVKDVLLSSIVKSTSITTSYSGANESKPYNVAVNFFIKY